MPTNLTEVASFDASVPVPNDFEGATAAGLVAMTQPLANRAQYLKSLAETTGVKIVRTVADVAALKALTGMASKEVCLVASTGTVYVYDSASVLAADDVLIVFPTSGTGRWFHVARGVSNTAYGLATLDVNSKIVQPVPNRVIEIADSVLGASFNNATTTYTTALNKMLTSTLVAGDKVLIHAHGVLTATVGAGTCYTQLAVAEAGGVSIALPGTEDTFDNSTIWRRSYAVLRTVVTGGSFEVRWQIKSGAAGNNATLAVPSAFTVQVIRP